MSETPKYSSTKEKPYYCNMLFHTRHISPLNTFRRISTRPTIVEMAENIDQRGIVHSVISRNMNARYSLIFERVWRLKKKIQKQIPRNVRSGHSFGKKPECFPYWKR